MLVSDFDFDLPAELIAQHPVTPRDSARLLRVANDLDDRSVADLPELLNPGDILVFNDTRVIPVRLAGMRGAARVEATLIKHVSPDTWNALVRPGKKFRLGDTVVFGDTLAAEVMAKGDGGEVALKFNCAGPDLMAALDANGAMPLPPYIKRERGGNERDRDDYQTLFAEKDGAVAAPTAGLHFTPGLMNALAERGLRTAFVTLHVGAGTFLPMKVDDTDDHKMHAEWGEVSALSAERINAARQAGGRVVAVGTTSLRLLESAAGPDGTLVPFADETDIFITPGYRFKIIDMLLTNFHLPKSTLFMLVSALAGTQTMKTAYAHAIANAYRFYSYGDCCLLSRDAGA